MNRPSEGSRVDLLISKTPFQEEALSRRQRIHLLGEDCWVVTVEDLVVYKLIAFRGRDRDDIEDVLRTQLIANAAIDWSYIERWAREWHILDRWIPLHEALHAGT